MAPLPLRVGSLGNALEACWPAFSGLSARLEGCLARGAGEYEAIGVQPWQTSRHGAAGAAAPAPSSLAVSWRIFGQPP